MCLRFPEATEGQGRRWQVWKIRRRLERAKAWMAAEDRGVPRSAAEDAEVLIKSVSSVRQSVDRKSGGGLEVR